jgi:hypothetical protein
MFTLALLSACGSEADFAGQQNLEAEDTLGHTGSILPSCDNTIEMTVVYANTSSALGEEGVGYCVTVYEASPSTNTCDAGTQEEHCSVNDNFHLKRLRNGCYAFTYNKQSTTICPSCSCEDENLKRVPDAL